MTDRELQENDEPPAGVPFLRLDLWLWYARFLKSRSLATKLCRSGQVRVNRVPIDKPHRAVRPGDVLTFPQGTSVRIIQVCALAERRGPAPEARLLYADLSPRPAATAGPPAAALPARAPGSGRPTKRERRQIERLREDAG